MAYMERTLEVPFLPEQMFDLVNDIPSYPKFLPWCADTKVLRESDGAMQAKITISKGKLTHSLITANSLIPKERIILNLMDGPFKYLRGSWEFLPIKNGCKVIFLLDFELRNKLLGMAFAAVNQHVVSALMYAFEKRAYNLYGNSRADTSCIS